MRDQQNFDRKERSLSTWTRPSGKPPVEYHNREGVHLARNCRKTGSAAGIPKKSPVAQAKMRIVVKTNDVPQSGGRAGPLLR